MENLVLDDREYSHTLSRILYTTNAHNEPDILAQVKESLTPYEISTELKSPSNESMAAVQTYISSVILNAYHTCKCTMYTHVTAYG